MNVRRPCVYIGVTNDIARRAWEHRLNAVGGFVRYYGVHRLVLVEFHETMADAIHREKASQEMAPCMETGVDRARSSAMA